MLLRNNVECRVPAKLACTKRHEPSYVNKPNVSNKTVTVMTGDYRNLTVGHVITYASLSTLLTLYLCIKFFFLKFSYVLPSIDSFHQFVWCKYLHLGETKPLLAQILYGCSYVIHIIVYTKEAVM